ncbi:MAG TPA: caspase family protein [Blastocatellia bacterium]|nr:caspase family protein [Blastocatellia bacterium]
MNQRTETGARFAIAKALPLILLASLVLPALGAFEPPPQAIIFQLEVPELGIAPTDAPEMTIATPNVKLIRVHVLRPQADNISPNQIYTFINGIATAIVSDVNVTERGKLVSIKLDMRPDFKLVPGRNTLEVRAENQRGRTFYASYILRTTTENRNQDFTYTVALGRDPKQQIPPELVLLEPETQVVLPRGRRSQQVRVSGVATAATSIERVTVNNQTVPLNRAQITMRKLGLQNEDNRVTFDTTIAVTPSNSQIVVEAIDTANNRTQLKIVVKASDDAPATEFRGKKYALIIGVSAFRISGYNLKYADADARAIQKFLLSPAGGRFPQDNIMMLTNEQATLARVKEALTTFAAQPGPDDLLLIFFASHGDAPPSAPQDYYYLTHDSDFERLSETGLLMRDLQTLVQQNVRARRVVLLIDTCHSAGLTGATGEMTRGLRHNLVNLYTEKLLYKEEGKAVITSSDVNESSAEGPRWGGGHGVFTYFLLEGLQGKADQNADRLVTVGELFSFVRQKVRLDTQFKQNPRLVENANENLTIAAVAGAVPAR